MGSYSKLRKGAMVSPNRWEMNRYFRGHLRNMGTTGTFWFGSIPIGEKYCGGTLVSMTAVLELVGGARTGIA